MGCPAIAYLVKQLYNYSLLPIEALKAIGASHAHTGLEVMRTHFHSHEKGIRLSECRLESSTPDEHWDTEDKHLRERSRQYEALTLSWN